MREYLFVFWGLVIAGMIIIEGTPPFLEMSAHRAAMRTVCRGTGGVN